MPAFYINKQGSLETGEFVLKIGIGIDTGGTCTDAVVYQLEEKKILAYGKTLTTKEDLSVGIGRVLDKLPAAYVKEAEVIALSTTLATNACVENKGGRAKLMLFGIQPSAVAAIGTEYGLDMDDSIYFVDSKTKPSGSIVREPDWNKIEQDIETKFADCDAVGIVEMYARKTGAVLEKKARDMIKAKYDIPVVCGHELFWENNIMKRGASALLNARLIPVIEEFLRAVKRALKERDIKAPFVIVRSDGSLMAEKFTVLRPVETLLCGPVASVMGAVELSGEKNCMIIDMGGTTTDIAFVKNGTAQRVKSGIRIGKWDTFVKGLFVDTFGLGGDSGVRNLERDLYLEDNKVMPLCIAAHKYPKLTEILRKENEKGYLYAGPQKDIYLGLKDISENHGYSGKEKKAAALLLHHPMTLERLGERMKDVILEAQISRLIREGVLIRCGLTPTDVMHVKGDFDAYDAEASRLGLAIMARTMRMTPEELGDAIYDEVKRKLYFNIVRILIEDAYPRIREEGIGEQLKILINDCYRNAKQGTITEFCGIRIETPAVLVGVGAPTHIFLEDVGKMLGTKVCTSEYSKVANALGAIVGNVSASVTIQISYDQEKNTYVIFGGGQRMYQENLEEAKKQADALAAEGAEKEAEERGADPDAIKTVFQRKENTVETDFGPLYMGYTVTASASGKLLLSAV